MGVSLSTKTVIDRFVAKHGDTYDYSEAIIVNGRIPIKITCKLHGPFMQRPRDHACGQGCPKCGRTKMASAQTDNAFKFIEKARQVHGDTYDYSAVEYVRSNVKVAIGCKTHGTFYQTPNKHIMGRRCPTCFKCFTLTKGTLAGFIARANKVHNNKYDYTLADYVNCDTHTTVKCPVHGPYRVTPYAHVTGHQCPKCAPYGLNQNKPAILYYIKILNNGVSYYKIGVTNKTVDERFSLPELQTISVLSTTAYKTGKEAYDAEQAIIKKYAAFKYVGRALLSSGGNTEIFTKDVLASE